MNKSRYDLQVINNSTERKTATVKFISNRGVGNIEWERKIQLQGLNNPSRNSDQPFRNQRRVDFNRPGSYSVRLSTDDDFDETHLHIIKGDGFPTDVELTGYINFDGSVEILHAVVD